MFEILTQGIIFTLGSASIILIAKKNKWGFVLGLCSQPFWIITSYGNDQWGIFLLSIVYTATWVFGIYEWFFSKNAKKV